MITITDLHTALLELLEKIRESEIKLINKYLHGHLQTWHRRNTRVPP